MHEDDSFRDKMPFHVEPEEFDDGSDGFKNLRNSLDQPATYCWTEATFVSLASMKFRPENGKGRWCTLCRHRPTTHEWYQVDTLISPVLQRVNTKGGGTQ